MSALDELESAERRVPAYQKKNDPRVSYDAMIEWLRSQDSSTRARVLTELPQWLGHGVEPWKNEAAMEIAVSLEDRDLLASAIAEARRRRAGPDGEGATDFGDRMVYQFLLVSALSRLSIPEGLDYLRELGALPYRQHDAVLRELVLRARITHCYLKRGPDEIDCLRDTLAKIRAVAQPALTNSIVGLLWALYVRRGRGHSLDGLLDADEMRTLRSFPGAAS